MALARGKQRKVAIAVDGSEMSINLVKWAGRGAPAAEYATAPAASFTTALCNPRSLSE